MSISSSECQEFARLVQKHFAFLADYGFKRAYQYEVSSSTFCKVVYLGKNVAIEIYLDVRDNYVGITVVKVINGVPKDKLHGGFHADLGDYLKRRGRFRKIPIQPFESSIETALAIWAKHLYLEGGEILEDTPHSLPITDMG